MSQIESVIVVGASAAGISCVRTLRQLGFLGSITLVDKDQHGAYERPPLSKQILMEADSTHHDIALISVDELLALNIEAYYGDSAHEVDPMTRRIILESGKELTADAIVLATGGEARRLPIEGADLPQVLVLRHYEDALNLR